MSIISFETSKILKRRSSIILLVATAVLFPSVVKVVSHLNVVRDNIPEGQFIRNVVFGILAYSQTYFFLPVWIIVFVGIELSNGHVNRVVFAKSRKFYFVSKIFFCGLITLLFCFLGVAALIIAIETSPFQLTVKPLFYFQFLLQLGYSAFAFTILLLSLVFIFRSPLMTFVVYFCWSFIEGILFTVFKGIYKIELNWLPLHLVRTLYTRNGEVMLENYYNPFTENPISLIAPTIFILVILIGTFYLFFKSNLKALSD